MKSSLLRSMDPLLPNSLKHGIAPSLYPRDVPAIRKFYLCLSTRFDSCDSLGLSFLTLSMPLPWRTFPQHTRGAKVPVATQARIWSQDERTCPVLSYSILILMKFLTLRTRTRTWGMVMAHVFYWSSLGSLRKEVNQAGMDKMSSAAILSAKMKKSSYLCH